MDGQIIRQSASYRQGLVLGLTMAEIMLLLVFCLLIAMATFLKIEHTKRQEAENRLRQEQLAGGADRELVEAIKNDPRLSELLNGAMGANDKTKVDEFWRELVESRATVSAAKQAGLSTAELRERVADLKALKEKGITVDKAVRNAAVTAAVDKVVARPVPATPEEIAKIVERGLGPQSGSGHKWPPIINLSEAGGYFFRTGSAELSPEFREALLDSTPRRIAEYIKQFDVDVIEVVGHTDEQPIGQRPSNLDRDLLPVLNGTANIISLVPADNAGLGLARAVSVVSVLRQSKLLAGLKVLPLSGAQLINTNETLTVLGTPGDIQERRRIEIRLRKTTPHDTSVKAPAIPAGQPTPTQVPPRRPAPKAAAAPAVPAPPASPGSPALRPGPRFLDATPPY
jgi:outer membrane protein OmpA-like peptidoglycan-associated protein